MCARLRENRESILFVWFRENGKGKIKCVIAQLDAPSGLWYDIAEGSQPWATSWWSFLMKKGIARLIWRFRVLVIKIQMSHWNYETEPFHSWIYPGTVQWFTAKSDLQLRWLQIQNGGDRASLASCPSNTTFFFSSDWAWGRVIRNLAETAKLTDQSLSHFKIANNLRVVFLSIDLTIWPDHHLVAIIDPCYIDTVCLTWGLDVLDFHSWERLLHTLL